jgi:cellulose synthase/poly-beta-1,6-N-acetylglucosamine synthase-like glycosyltransferase
MFRNPKWINEANFSYQSFEEVPEAVFNAINKELDLIQSDNPVVSVVICAWNEEVNILKTVASLAKTKTKHAIELIVINNNSTDRTQDTLDKLHVSSFFQPIQGWGPARQMGIEKARGRYILTADADSFYSPFWVDDMISELQKPGIVCVYGRYSFISQKGYPRWKLFTLERMKDVIAEVRHYKRPYLNAYGVSMGYHREQALKIGFVMKKIRGEDGRLCFDLMKYGKIKQVKMNRSRAWTSPRTLQKDGEFSIALWKRVSREVKRFHTLFVPLPQHDTKTSENA